MNDDIVVLEPGEYTLEVVCASVDESTIVPVYRVVDGPHEDELAKMGKLPLTGMSAAISLRRLGDLGIDRGFMALAESLQEIADALVGRTIRAQVLMQDNRNFIFVGGFELIAVGPGGGAVNEGATDPPTPDLRRCCAQCGRIGLHGFKTIGPLIHEPTGVRIEAITVCAAQDACRRRRGEP